jgi:hypothetical protein
MKRLLVLFAAALPAAADSYTVITRGPTVEASVEIHTGGSCCEEVDLGPLGPEESWEWYWHRLPSGRWVIKCRVISYNVHLSRWVYEPWVIRRHVCRPRHIRVYRRHYIHGPRARRLWKRYHRRHYRGRHFSHRGPHGRPGCLRHGRPPHHSRHRATRVKPSRPVHRRSVRSAPGLHKANLRGRGVGKMRAKSKIHGKSYRGGSAKRRNTPVPFGTERSRKRTKVQRGAGRIHRVSHPSSGGRIRRW